MYDIRQRSMLDGRLFTLAGLAKRTGRRRVWQRCAGLSRTGLAGLPQDGPQDNIAVEFSVAAKPQAISFKICSTGTLELKTPDPDSFQFQNNL